MPGLRERLLDQHLGARAAEVVTGDDGVAAAGGGGDDLGDGVMAVVAGAGGPRSRRW